MEPSLSQAIMDRLILDSPFLMVCFFGAFVVYDRRRRCPGLWQKVILAAGLLAGATVFQQGWDVCTDYYLATHPGDHFPWSIGVCAVAILLSGIRGLAVAILFRSCVRSALGASVPVPAGR